MDYSTTVMPDHLHDENLALSLPASASTEQAIYIREWGCVDYAQTWQAMLEFNRTRTAATPDELWILEHPPTLTLGQAAQAEHILHDLGIPQVRTDRGGQVTYHGPGQLIVYLLLDLGRKNIKVKDLVARIEQAIINSLERVSVQGERRTGAPGVYVAGAKIAALGLKVSRGCCYHGLSLNVDMDLSPFSAINPCGYAHLPVTQTRDLGITWDLPTAASVLTACLLRQLEK